MRPCAVRAGACDHVRPRATACDCVRLCAIVCDRVRCVRCVRPRATVWAACDHVRPRAVRATVGLGGLGWAYGVEPILGPLDRVTFEESEFASYF